MDLRKAQEILEHLIKTNQGFCFLTTGELVSREDCYKIIQQKTAI